MAVTTEAQGRGDAGFIAAATLVGSLCLLYMTSQFLRNSMGVVAPELARDLALRPEELGFLSGAFYLSFAAAQLPLGVLIDRYGPLRILLASLAPTLLGVALFASSDSMAGLVAGRLLMGLGCSSFLMAPLTIYARRFPPSRFSTVTGVQIGIGSLGALAATAPLAFFVDALGWRASFLLSMLFTASAGFLVFAFARDRPQGAAPRARETLIDSVRGVLEAARMPDVAPLFAMHFAANAALVTVLGLWSGPYLADVYGLSLEERGGVLLLMASATILGAFAWGPTDRLFKSRKLPIAVGAAAATAILCALTFLRPSIEAVAALLAAFGFVLGCGTVLIAHGRSLFPDALIGRGMALLNMATMGGAFALQSLTGFVVGLFPAAAEDARSLEAYQAAFGTQALWLGAALLIYLRAADRPPR